MHQHVAVDQQHSNAAAQHLRCLRNETVGLICCHNMWHTIKLKLLGKLVFGNKAVAIGNKHVPCACSQAEVFALLQVLHQGCACILQQLGLLWHCVHRLAHPVCCKTGLLAHAKDKWSQA
jgi:hypothetical protein